MRCASLNREGKPCRQYAQRGSDLCHYHAMVLPLMKCFYEAKARHVELNQVVAEKGWLVVDAKGQPEPGIRLLKLADVEES